jgi:hypothetical protein
VIRIAPERQAQKAREALEARGESAGRTVTSGA